MLLTLQTFGQKSIKMGASTESAPSEENLPTNRKKPGAGPGPPEADLLAIKPATGLTRGGLNPL